jgi:predicted alpha/beta-hydrolase family hydrolase
MRNRLAAFSATEVTNWAISDPIVWFLNSQSRPNIESAMPASESKPVVINVDEGIRVSGLLQSPSGARACFVVAHGAGAGMTHPFMATVAAELAERGVATLRYQFPYMEKGGKRPDPPKLAHAAVRAAVAEAARLVPGFPLIAGGKSFGGRMTSQAQAAAPLQSVEGLAFLGFPLHPAGRPARERGQHLFEVQIPMLFLQGTRDALAALDQLAPLCKALGRRASLKLFEDADHSFHVPARTGKKDSQVRSEMLDALVEWIEVAVAGSRSK